MLSSGADVTDESDLTAMPPNARALSTVLQPRAADPTVALVGEERDVWMYGCMCVCMASSRALSMRTCMPVRLSASL